MNTEHHVCSEEQGIALQKLGVTAPSCLRSLNSAVVKWDTIGREENATALYYYKDGDNAEATVPRYNSDELIAMLPSVIWRHPPSIGQPELCRLSVELCVEYSSAPPASLPAMWRACYLLTEDPWSRLPTIIERHHRFLGPTPAIALAALLIDLLERGGELSASAVNDAAENNTPYELNIISE